MSHEQPILLCFDGSEHARSAIREAAALLGRRPAVVVSVWEPAAALSPLDPIGDVVGRFSGVYAELDEVGVELARRHAHDGAQLAATLMAGVRPRPACGPVWQTIVRVAEEEDAAVIVVGARGLSGPAAALGSVSARVARHAGRGRSGGRDALALAALLQTAADGGELTAVHVYPYDCTVSLDEAGAVEAVLHEDLAARLEGELAAAGVGARAVVVSDPAPARALLALAERERADVVVVGSSHRAGADRVLAGDVTANVLHGAPCAVAVAPRGFAATPQELRTIGVGFDESPEACAALDLAGRLARVAHARVRAILVVAPWRPMWPVAVIDPASSRAETELLAAAQERLGRLLAELEGVAGGEAVYGRPADALVERSADLDLLVVGSRGYGPLRRLLLGSTSSKLVRAATCPVVVTPRVARESQRPSAATAAGAA